MGLCKCPKRKVTNLFCFEHDVNVCEYCLVANHERCIVQSYVQWLQDSDYNPICILCKQLLADEQTVRLICYDVFHWSCLNKYAASLPANTAPAGYQCPKCKECLFPPSNLVSPVVDALKARLSQVSWAKIGLGQSLIDTGDVGNQTNVVEDETNEFVIVSNKAKSDPSASKSSRSSNTSFPFLHGSANENKNKSDLYRAYNPINDSSTVPKSHSRSAFNKDDSESTLVLNFNNSDRDSGENKYKRRPLIEWFKGLLRSRQVGGPNAGLRRFSRQKRCFYLCLLIFLFLSTIILIFSRLSSIKTDNDPFLDPMNNPNIRVE